MQILIHFKGKDVPNVISNRFGLRFKEINDFTINENFFVIQETETVITAINTSIVAAIESKP